MTVTTRKAPPQPEEVPAVNEPGEQYSCDSCSCDLTHTIRIKCADPVCCETEEGVDICPRCFCAGKEFGQHKRGHAYRVIEFNSYPIFCEDWGADEELLLVKGIQSQGFGNWRKIADHIGTRTKEEVEAHYNEVYINSPTWPIPRMDLTFDVDPGEFQERKRRRIGEINSRPPPPFKAAPVSLPGIHEVATFLPGRLEFEHELDNEAEELVKDLEFGIVHDYGGDQIPEDENDPDVKARAKIAEEKNARPNGIMPGMKAPLLPIANGINGIMNGHHPPTPLPNGTSSRTSSQKDEDASMQNGTDGDDENMEEATQPPPYETADSIALKLTMLEMYFQRVERRDHAKAIMFDRGLLEYKKMQAADKKRPREEREIFHRLRPFGQLQTASDFEEFAADIIYESILRKRIHELQTYRRLGLMSAADIDKYELDLAKRTQARAIPRDYYASERLQVKASGRQSSLSADPRRSSHDNDDKESTPGIGGSASAHSTARRPAPLNLANSAQLHLLTAGEQTLCSTLRIMPKVYLSVKEVLVREYARRGGKLRRREARDLVKIDVNKTARIWDFLVQTGFLKINPDVPAAPSAASAPPNGVLLNGSPVKDSPRIPGPVPSSLISPRIPSSLPSIPPAPH